ncbi:MAG TPA: hypothetical protein VN706_18335 [Gemmatimonadaceae bacterium]|nr:hypothetical protein [Gemmatimonadaceae bacterium]
MRTRRNGSVVSIAARAVLVAALGVGVSGACGACARPQTPVPQLQTGILEFDNQATVYVDVYLVGGRDMQWRLGRVPAGMRAALRVPESAIDWTEGFVQLAVIPGSQTSAEAWRDPRAIIAIAQPLPELMSQEWTVRPQAGAALALQATRLRSGPPF